MAAAAPTLAQQFDGLTRADTGKARPDTALATGPDHVVEAVNSAWVVYDHAGRTVRARTTFLSWFSDQGITQDGFFNPRLVYRDGHFYLVVLWLNQSTQSSLILLSVSRTSDPTSSWCNYRFDGTTARNTAYADFPNVGITSNGLYIATDHYRFSAGGYETSTVRIIRRADVDACRQTTVREFGSFSNSNGSPAFALHPAVDFDAGGDTAAYAINSWSPFSASADRITVWRVANPLGSAPTWSRWTVATRTYSAPPDAPQPNRVNLDTIDAAMLSAVRRNGLLWAVHGTGLNPGCSQAQSAIHWIALTAPAATDPARAPTLQQDGYLNGPCGEAYFMPALTVTGTGDTVVVFNRSSASSYPEIRFTGRSPGDAAGTMAGSQVLIGRSFASSSGTWGAYNAAAPDPRASGRAWIAGEYLAGSTAWATRVGAIDVAGQPPTITVQPASQTVAAGQSATFRVTASGSGPLSYQWQRNGVNIAGATSSSYTVASAQLSDDGATFRCVVRNSFGSVTSAAATLRVTNGGTGGTEGYEVYTDGLRAGWVDWSWNSTRNFAVTNPVYQGTRALSVTITAAWGALNLHTDAAVDLTTVTHLRFAARAAGTGQEYTVVLLDEGLRQLTPVALSAYGGAPSTGSWTAYHIPLTDLGATGKQITGIRLQDRSGGAQPALYVDALGFTSSGGSSGSLGVYTDSLATGWANWSWGGTANFGVTSPVYEGTRSIGFAATSAWAGLNLHADAAVDTGPYTHVRFAAQAAATGQTYYVQLRGAGGVALTPAQSLTVFGGPPPVGAWREYVIALDALGATSPAVTGIVIQAGSGVPSTLYVDGVMFTTLSTADASGALEHAMIARAQVRAAP